MTGIALSIQARSELAETIQAINFALVESPFMAKLHDLALPALLRLAVDTERDESLVGRLLPVRFLSLLRAARAAVSSEPVTDRLLSLGFVKVFAVLEELLPDVRKGVSRLSALRFQQYARLLEQAAQDGPFAEMLRLFGFPDWVDLLSAGLHNPVIAKQLLRLDFHRLWRAATVMLGLSCVAANGEGLNAETVLRGAPAPAKPPSKRDRLAADPYSFDFHWALRCLQVERAEYPKIGRSTRLADDFLRLRQEPDVRFAPSTLREFIPGADSAPDVLSVNFLGLFGPNGALPSAITEHALDRMRDRDFSIAHFADVFHHRVLSLFHRAWQVHQKAADLDRHEDRRFANYIASFHGLGQPSLRDRDAVPDLAKLYFSGRLAPAARNAEGLEAILGEFFGMPCEVHPFHGHWITISQDQACALGSSPDRCSLGTTAIVGSRVFQYQTKFRLRLGPMRLSDLQRLLPCAASWPRLKAWVRNYLGDEFLWDAQYVLLAREVPKTQLGGGALLGWTTWITSREPARDADDVVIDSDLH
jgi:type VI secretion system protein ImpH